MGPIGLEGMGFWWITNAPVVTLADGVTFNGGSRASSAASYAPASDFGVPESRSFPAEFTVTGSPGTSTVPEPSSLLLLSTGLFGGIGAMRRRFPK